MKKTIIVISSLFMVSLVASSVFAWSSGRGQKMNAGYYQDCHGYGGQQQRVFNNLSQEQIAELSALRQKFIDETYELRSAKFQKQQEMRMLMETSEPDKVKLDKLSREISDLQKQIRDKGIEFRLAAKKISPELGMGMGRGFGQGCARGLRAGGQISCFGQGPGCYYNN